MDPQRATVPAFDVFVSYNSKNRAEVTRLARNLEGLGVRVWFDRSCLTPGGDWQLELAEGLAGSSACAVCVGPEDLGAWTRMEASAALNRASRDNEFRVFPVLLPGVVKFRPASLPPFLATRTWVDMRSGVDTERGLEDLRCAILGIAPGADLEVKQNADVCPYRGLEAFDEEHAHLYFGRESYVQRVLEELRGGRFLAVVGPSGSGKLAGPGRCRAQIAGWRVAVQCDVAGVDPAPGCAPARGACRAALHARPRVRIVVHG